MSNRRRRSLSADQRRTVREALVCPDCTANVRVSRRGGAVFHDQGCPSLAALRADRRTNSLMLVDPTGEQVRRLAEAALANPVVLGLRVSTHPYAGLRHEPRQAR